MDDSIVIILLKNAWILICGVFGWIGRGMYSDIRNLQKSDADCKLDLANFKTHVSESHPTKNDLNAARMETKDSVDRLHSRLDSVATDIKTILSTMKR